MKRIEVWMKFMEKMIWFFFRVDYVFIFGNESLIIFWFMFIYDFILIINVFVYLENIDINNFN